MFDHLSLCGFRHIRGVRDAFPIQWVCTVWLLYVWVVCDSHWFSWVVPPRAFSYFSLVLLCRVYLCRQGDVWLLCSVLHETCSPIFIASNETWCHFWSCAVPSKLSGGLEGLPLETLLGVRITMFERLQSSSWILSISLKIYHFIILNWISFSSSEIFQCDGHVVAINCLTVRQSLASLMGSLYLIFLLSRFSTSAFLPLRMWRVFTVFTGFWAVYP